MPKQEKAKIIPMPTTEKKVPSRVVRPRSKQKAKTITIKPKPVLTATQKIHEKVAQVNQGIPPTFKLQYNSGRLDIYANEFDAKKKLIVKHREHTFIEGTKKEINIFLDGMSAVYIIIQNHNARTKLAQKQAEKTATPKKKEPIAQTRARLKQKPKPKPKEVKH